MRLVSRVVCVVSFVAILGAGKAFAGPVVIDGTDANDHGSVLAGVNQEGWEYMQRALENLATELLLGNPLASKTVLSLGLSGGQAGAAFDSAFNLSNIAVGCAPNCFTKSNVDGSLAVAAALASLSTSTTGILYLPTYNNSGGDLDALEMAAINAAAAQIANFVNAGGALFAMAESGAGAWGWLTTLLPGLIANDVGAGGIGSSLSLTVAGSAAFPGLNTTDIDGAIPWHGFFSGNLGSLQVLAVETDSSRAVIIGGGRSTVIQPTIPEPATLLLFGSGLAGLYRRRMRKAQA